MVPYEYIVSMSKLHKMFNIFYERINEKLLLFQYLMFLKNIFHTHNVTHALPLESLSALIPTMFDRYSVHKAKFLCL